MGVNVNIDNSKRMDDCKARVIACLPFTVRRSLSREYCSTCPEIKRGHSIDLTNMYTLMRILDSCINDGHYRLVTATLRQCRCSWAYVFDLRENMFSFRWIRADKYKALLRRGIMPCEGIIELKKRAMICNDAELSAMVSKITYSASIGPVGNIISSIMRRERVDLTDFAIVIVSAVMGWHWCALLFLQTAIGVARRLYTFHYGSMVFLC